MPDDLAQQIAPLHEVVRAQGWPLLMIEGVEADDVIGTLALQAAAAGVECTVSTSDKDLAQLVRPGIRLVNTMSNEKLDDAGVLAKFGVRADQVLDLLALTGDAVDNVPGVPKVGPKTAAKWLTQYGTLDAVIAHANEIPGVVGENLRAALAWLPTGKKLLTVKTDCALPVKPTDLVREPPARGGTARALRALRVQELAQGRARGPPGPWRGDRGPRRARRHAPLRRGTHRRHRARARRAARGSATLRDGARRRRVRALDDSDRERRPGVLRHRDDEPRSDAGEDRRIRIRDRAGPRVLYPA